MTLAVSDNEAIALYNLQSSSKNFSKTKYLPYKVNKKVIENLSQKIDILITIIKERELNFKSFVIGFHEYRNMQ